MADRSPADLRVMAEVARAASAPADIEQRAKALVEPLRQIMPFDGIWISLLDPELREQPPLLSLGMPDGLDAYLSGPDGVADVEAAGLSGRPMAVSVFDLGIPLDELRCWTEYLHPAGYRGGLAASLFTKDGRYLGVIGLANDDRDAATAAVCELVGQLAPVIAKALDPMRSLTTAAASVRDAWAGAILTRAGNSIPLPGLPEHPLLRPASPALTVVHGVAAEQIDYATFLSPWSDGGYARVTWLRCGIRPSLHLAGAVVVSAAGDLRDLDRTDLRMLGMLIEGWPVPRIAAALAVTAATVGSHLERSQHKLGASSVDIVTLRALRLGLYVPPTFVG